MASRQASRRQDTFYVGAFKGRRPYLSANLHAHEDQTTATLEERRRDLDIWIAESNEQRPHQGRWCYGKTPMQTFLDTVPVAQEKWKSTEAQAH